jgi:hypothetical protein
MSIINKLPANNKIAASLALIMALIIAIIIGNFILTNKYIDADGDTLFSLENAQKLSFNLNEIRSLNQSFRSTQDNLARVTFLVDNNRQPNTFTVFLIDGATGNELYRKNIIVSVKKNSQTITLVFPQQANSKNKTYDLIINPLQSNDLYFLAINNDIYPNGNLKVDDVLLSDNLVFSFQYVSNRPASLALERTVLFKTGIFRLPGTIVLLFVLLNILLILFIYTFSKKLFSE